MILEGTICFEMLPPLTLPPFLNFVTPFFYVLSSQLTHFSLLISLFNILFWQRWTGFLAWAKMIVATHSFKYCFTVIAVAIIMQTVSFLLLSGCVKTLNFTFWFQLLIEAHYHVLDNFCPVFSSFKSISFRVLLPSGVKSSRHLLAHWEWI